MTLEVASCLIYSDLVVRIDTCGYLVVLPLTRHGETYMRLDAG